MDSYIASLKKYIGMLKTLPVLTVKQIKDYDDDCIRMYLYCYYGYSEFYNYSEFYIIFFIIFKYFLFV